MQFESNILDRSVGKAVGFSIAILLAGTSNPTLAGPVKALEYSLNMAEIRSGFAFSGPELGLESWRLFHQGQVSEDAFAWQNPNLFNPSLLSIEVEPFIEPTDVLLTISGEAPGDGFGWVAENLGDLNQDGVDDFITTAPFFTTNLPLPGGKIYIYSGKDGELLNSVVSPGFPLFGWSAKAAGDIDTDGVGDYVVGSLNGVVVFSGRTHQIIHAWTKRNEFFGSAVDRAGDLNQDGVEDIVVGARYASYKAPFAGRVYAYSGADGSLLWTRDGKNERDQLGTAIGFVGDVSHDGIPDIVVGARGAGSEDAGLALVLSGTDGDKLLKLRPVGKPGLVTDSSQTTAGTFGLFHSFGIGDVNGDGLADIYVGDYNAFGRGVNGTGRGYVFSGADGKRLHVFRPENPGDGFGPARGVGDVDGDGANDLFIASYTYTAGLNNGKGYVYSGVTGAILDVYTGAVANQYLGVDALGMGDINGDGKVDFMLTGSGILHIVAGR